jgi:hypothetical protein
LKPVPKTFLNEVEGNEELKKALEKGILFEKEKVKENLPDNKKIEIAKILALHNLSKNPQFYNFSKTESEEIELESNTDAEAIHKMIQNLKENPPTINEEGELIADKNCTAYFGVQVENPTYKNTVFAFNLLKYTTTHEAFYHEFGVNWKAYLECAFYRLKDQLNTQFKADVIRCRGHLITDEFNSLNKGGPKGSKHQAKNTLIEKELWSMNANSSPSKIIPIQKIRKSKSKSKLSAQTDEADGQLVKLSSSQLKNYQNILKKINQISPNEIMVQSLIQYSKDQKGLTADQVEIIEKLQKTYNIKN